jgi:hypothetical protein
MIALACGADPATIDQLNAAWRGVVEVAVTSSPLPLALPSPEPAPPKRRAHTSLFVAAAAVAAVIAAAVVVIVALQPAPPSHGHPPAAQQISGPAWTLPAAPVASTLFGATVNSPSGDMPTFPLGAVRFWDSETRWSLVEPARHVYDWRTLDGLVAGAGKAGLPALYVFGGTPAWAAPDGAQSVYPEGARSAPPDDPAEWDRFVRAVVGRYRGRIEAYELWVLGNDKRMWTGTPEALVAMTRRASRIIRAVDPKATVVCPGMGNLWTDEGQQVLKRFADLGGYGYCDVAGIKLYQKIASDPPETMLNLLTGLDRLLHEAGVHPRLWNTGTTYTIALQQPLDQETAREYAVRFFLVGLYARSFSLERMYFYNWGGTKVPIVLQADGGRPTPAAYAVATLERWLAPARIRSCGHGVPAGLPEHAWQCDFQVGGRPASILWTDSGTAMTVLDAPVTAVRHLDGRADHPVPGDRVELTGEPLFIQYR